VHPGGVCPYARPATPTPARPAPVSPASVRITPPTTPIISIGDILPLTYVITPANTTADNTVSWFSSNENIVRVSNTGVLTAVGIGTATITLTTANGRSDNFEITVDAIAVASVEFSEPINELEINTNHRLSVEVLPANATDKTIIWESSNDNVIRVNSSGNIRAVSAGTAIISATSVNGVRASINIRVYEIEVEEIRIILRNRTTRDRQFNVGDTVDFSVFVFPENATNQNYTIEYSDPSIINITENNSFEFIHQGELTITATAENGEFGYIKIVSTLPVENIEIEAESTDMNVMESMTLAYKIKPDNATIQTVEWVSLNEDVVHVDSSGKITAIKTGTAIVKAVSHNGKEAAIKLTVILPVSSVVLSVNENDFHTGEKQLIILEIYPEDATLQKITWASLNSDIARIDSSGNITALKSGEAVIRATAHNGIYSDITIIILPVYLRWIRDYGYIGVVISVVSVCAVLALRRIKINKKLTSRMIKNKPVQRLLK